MKRGYVKLWRKSFDSGLMSNANLWLFWSWCLLKASHKKRTELVGYQNVELNPGDFVFGRHKAAAALNLSERTIRTCLEALKIADRVTIKSTSKYSVVTIVNWDTYQSDAEQNDQQNGIQTTNETTSKRPASDQQATTNNNVKECKEDISIAETKVSTNGNCPYQKIVDLYHTILPDSPRVRALSKKRQGYIRARWNEKYATKDGIKSNTLEFWEIFFKYISESDFLTGKVDPQPGRNRFIANLEWVTNESNFLKIFEGNYHG